MADPAVLRQEQEAFEEQLKRLLAKHESQWAVFKGREVIDFFDDHESAYSAALDRFGPDATFLVVRVEKSPPRPVSVAWDAGVMFG